MRRPILILILAAGCAKPAPAPDSPASSAAPPPIVVSPPPAAPTTATPPPEAGPPADAPPTQVSDNDVALQLYATQRSTPGNVFLSPASVRAALAMVYAGARGETASQIARALGFAPDVAQTSAAFGALMKTWNAPSDPAVQLKVANRLWGQKGARFAPEFVGVLRDSFGAPLEEVDFHAMPEPSRLKINAWVASQTANLIRDLLQRGDVDAQTNLVLTNAIYFKGKWANPFAPAATKPAAFHVSEGKDVKAPFMTRRGRYSWAETPEATLLSLPYGKGDFSMLVVLPKATAGVDDLEKHLSSAWVDEMTRQMKPREVVLFLPKFTTTKRMTLRDALSSMGMPIAFQAGHADLSGMSGDAKDLYLHDAIQKAFVKVDEVGTEAAAATGAVVTYTMATEPLTFRADHPFVYFIRDAAGHLLFIGRLADPSQT